MRYIDLELYRWKFHHDIYMKRKAPSFYQKHQPGVRMHHYWKEYGAFVSVLPRQSGKSTMIGVLAKEFDKNNEKFIIVTPNTKMQMVHVSNGIQPKSVVSAGFHSSNVYASLCMTPEHYNVMIDEFNCIDREVLNEILDYNWKTVTMVGSL